jgi:hypothetical protein
MLSYRENLANIGMGQQVTLSYNAFYSRPQSLRQAILSMQAPASIDWHLHEPEIHRDECWTDEVQGVAWDGSNWIFSTNANQKKPGANDKAIYVFKGRSKLKDDQWYTRIDYKNVPHPISGTHESDDHWGQLCYWNGRVYVSHWWKGGPKHGVGSVVVFNDADGLLEYSGQWIELEKPTSPSDGRQGNVEFQAINPWDGMLYTCFGSGKIYEFFLHDIETGAYTGKTLKFSGGEKKARILKFPEGPVDVDLPLNVAGACFSPNGHLYVACDVRLANNTDCKAIAYFSALNGHLMGIIPVVAEESVKSLRACATEMSHFPTEKARKFTRFCSRTEMLPWTISISNPFRQPRPKSFSRSLISGGGMP